MSFESCTEKLKGRETICAEFPHLTFILRSCHDYMCTVESARVLNGWKFREGVQKNGNNHDIRLFPILFFKPCRIVPGLPKHVFVLVWIVYC